MGRNHYYIHCSSFLKSYVALPLDHELISLTAKATEHKISKGTDQRKMRSNDFKVIISNLPFCIVNSHPGVCVLPPPIQTFEELLVPSEVP